MMYTEILNNLRNEIVCGINSALAQVDNGSAILFNEPVESDTFTDYVCGESFTFDGIYKDNDGDLFIITTDGADDTIRLDRVNTHDLGAILDEINSKDCEITSDLDGYRI